MTPTDHLPGYIQALALVSLVVRTRLAHTHTATERLGDSDSCRTQVDFKGRLTCDRKSASAGPLCEHPAGWGDEGSSCTNMPPDDARRINIILMAESPPPRRLVVTLQQRAAARAQADGQDCRRRPRLARARAPPRAAPPRQSTTRTSTASARVVLVPVPVVRYLSACYRPPVFIRI